MRRAGWTLILAALLASPALAASPAAGVWKAARDGAEIELFDCAAQLCGRILTSNRLKQNPEQTDLNNEEEALKGRPIKGLVIMQGFSGGPVEWKGGRIYDPERGSTFLATVRLASANELRLTGCLVYPVCRTETWARLK